VEGRRFLDRIKSMPDGDMRISLDGNVLTIKGTSHSRKFSIQTIPADDWPKMAQPDDKAPVISLSSSLFATLIDATILAVHTDENRLGLSSLLVEFEKNNLRCVGLDGHRCHVAEATCEIEPHIAMLIPLRTAQSIKAFVAGQERNIEIQTTGSWGFIDSESARVGFRLCDAQFPPYDQVIPKPGKVKATFSRSGLIASVKALTSVTNGTKGLKITSESDLLTLSGGTSEDGEGEDTVKAYTKGNVIVGANPKYLVDALSSITGDDAVFYFGGELDPILLVPSDPSDGFEFQIVIMPMRVE
jgi:DNA polymerase-3 subunit beta